jgi:hypothetical protein
MPPADLAPSLRAARRRQHTRIAVAIGVGIHLILLGLLLPRTGVRERPVVASPPVLVPVIAPQVVVQVVALPPPPVVVMAPQPAPVHRTCPPRVTTAPRPRPAALPFSITRVRPSRTHAGWIAAWNADAVLVSRDAGRTFQRMLDGDGTVADVDFDCFGRVLVIRDGQLGVHDGTRERWQRLPVTFDEGGARLAGGGPDVAVYGQQEGSDWGVKVVISSDLGRGWRTRELEGLPGEADAFQDATGTVHVVTAYVDCRHNEMHASRITPDGTISTSEQAVAQVSVGAYPRGVLAGAEWLPTGASETERIDGLDTDVAEQVIPGPRPMIVAGETAYRIANGGAKRLPWIVEGEPQAVDAAGRLWTVHCGRALVAGPRASGLTCPEEGA